MKRKKFSLFPFFALVVCLLFCFVDYFKKAAKAQVVVSESGIYIDGGSYIFEGGTISGKISTSGFGGGVCVVNGDFTMRGGEISNNTPFGIYGSGGNITIDNGNITNNAMYGIYYEHGTILTLNGGAVFGQTMGLVSIDASAIMNNCDIVNNDQMGVYITDCTFAMNDGKIQNNGCGFAMLGGDFTMKNGTISDNVDENMGYGVLIYDGNFTMNGGQVSNNGVAHGVGGGVHLVDGNFTMNGGSIEGNNSEHCGGGVYVLNGTFTMVNGIISGNSTFAADETMGGGVYVGDGTFIMEGGEISDNNATLGNAVYVDGTFEYSGGIINGEIALGSPFANMIISQEPEKALEIYFHEGDLEYNNGKIAKLVGVDSIDLSKIKLSNHPDAKLSIVVIDGEKWIVNGNYYKIEINAYVFRVVEGKYAEYSLIPPEKLLEAVDSLELQVPEGTKISYDEHNNYFKVGEKYYSVVSHIDGYPFGHWTFYEESGASQVRLPIIVKSAYRIEAVVFEEVGETETEIVFFTTIVVEAKKQSNEYYIENKRLAIKSIKKEKGVL